MDKTVFKVENGKMVERKVCERCFPAGWFNTKSEATADNKVYQAAKKAKIADFKKELKELLTKHNASINLDFADCSDTHGMYDEKMIVEIRDGKTRFEATLSTGYSVDAHDLK